MGNNQPRQLAALVWVCDECGSEIKPTGDSDGAHVYYQCGRGHMYARPVTRTSVLDIRTKRRTGYTPNDAA